MSTGRDMAVGWTVLTVAIESNGRTRAERLELERLDPMALARAEDLMHEMRAHLEQMARVEEARRAREGTGEGQSG